MPFIQFTFALGLLFVLVCWLWRKTAAGTGWNKIFWPALAFKLLCGILLGLYYNGFHDTFVYQHYADKITVSAHSDFSAYLKFFFRNELLTGVEIEFKPFSNSFFFVKILSILNFITGKQYYLNGFFLSLFSFSGCWIFVRTLAQIFPGAKKAAVMALLFIPSVVFWNAGVMKEPVLMGTLCFFWALVLKTVYFPGQNLVIRSIFILFFCWLLWKIKLFLALIVYALTLSWVFLRWLRCRFGFFRSNRNFAGFLLGVSILAAAGLGYFLQLFANAFFYRHLVWNYETLLRQSAGKPVLELHNLRPEWSSVLLNLPKAVFGAIFRPFIWEGDNWFYHLAGLESLILVLLFLGMLPSLKHVRQWSVPGFFLLLFAFICIMAALIGLTTPNLGTLNRYRTVFLPFLVFLLLQLPFWQNLFHRIFPKTRQQ